MLFAQSCVKAVRGIATERFLTARTELDTVPK